MIHDIHLTKMEQLVKSVFEVFFLCEVKHCGRAGDGGVDLLVVVSDAPTAVVQVKRRRDENAVESASVVRELLGAAVLRGVKEAIFVTTADHFSHQSIKEAQTAMARRIVTRFELIDRHRFMASLRLVQPETVSRWSNHLLTRRMVERRNASMCDVVDYSCSCGALIHSNSPSEGHRVRCAVCGRVTVLRRAGAHGP